ncbi:hypothetical protein [Streptomyces sp. NPDC005969]|uniref:hypothetical protein n=1 Tax=Streptomyces sp. NPDC005969 TaxID=3156722 RepID=UPI0033F4143D
MCDLLALITSELVDDLARFGAGRGTALLLTADDTAVTVCVRATLRPRRSLHDSAIAPARGVWPELTGSDRF